MFVCQVTSGAPTVSTQSNDDSDGGDATEEQHDSVRRRDGDEPPKHASDTNDLPHGVPPARQQGRDDGRGKV